MSVTTVTVGFLGIKPKIWIEGEELYARTSIVSQILSLLSSYRSLHINKRMKILELYTRNFWIISHYRTIRFEEIYYIDYDFSAFTTAIGGAYRNYESTDQLEFYTVSLVLKNNEKVKLFSFWGEGSCSTGWKGVLLSGDSIVDMEGDQGDVSRDFVEVLQKFLGVGLGVPMKHLADKQGNKYFCKKCNRPSAPGRKECMYCGAKVISPSNPQSATTKEKRLYCAKCNRYFKMDKSHCLYCAGSLTPVEIEDE